VARTENKENEYHSRSERFQFKCCVWLELVNIYQESIQKIIQSAERARGDLQHNKNALRPRKHQPLTREALNDDNDYYYWCGGRRRRERIYNKKAAKNKKRLFLSLVVHIGLCVVLIWLRCRKWEADEALAALH